MVDRVEINNEESARDWLEAKNQKTRIWFAARCALRTLPWLHLIKHEGSQPTILRSLRANLNASAASTYTGRASNQLKTTGMTVLRSRHGKRSIGSIRTQSAVDASSAAEKSIENVNSLNEATKAAAHFAAAFAENTEIDTKRGSAAAYSVVNLDVKTPNKWGPLWPKETQPSEFDDAWRRLKDQWNAESIPNWSFWIEWYERILDGNPIDWDLTFRIATEITDDEWDAGQSRVADRIEEIKQDFYGNPLDQDALRSHLQKVVESPAVFADSAESVASLTLDAIDRFKNTEPKCNQLPEGYATFEELPRQFSAISIVLRSSDDGHAKAAKLQDEVNRLKSLVQQLEREATDARRALAEERLTSVEAKQIRTFGERLHTTLTSVTLVGAIGMTTLGFFGVTAEDLKYDALKRALQGLAEDMENVRPSTEIDLLPPATEV